MDPNLQKRIPPHHAGKVEGLGDSAKPQKLYALPYSLDAEEQLIE